MLTGSAEVGTRMFRTPFASRSSEGRVSIIMSGSRSVSGSEGRIVVPDMLAASSGDPGTTRLELGLWGVFAGDSSMGPSSALYN